MGSCTTLSSGRRSIGRRVRVFLIAAAALLPALTTAPAWGQPGGGGGGFGDALSPPVNSREIEDFSKILGLTKDQEAAARLLLEGYMEQFQAKAGAVRERMEAAREESRESRDPAAWQGIREQMQAFRAERTAMEESFMGDLQAILEPAQAEQWPRVERAHRRTRTVGRGLMSGERVDLIQLVDQAQLPEQAKGSLGEVLAEYELALDRELIQRNRVYEENSEKMSEMFRAGDPAQMQALMDESRDASRRVREVNRTYARRLGELLPEDSRPAFAQAVQRASFPEVYRPSPATRGLVAARAFADLTEEQTASITALDATHARSLDAVNTKLAAAREQTEETMTIGQMWRRGGGRDGGDDATSDLRREKRDLERATAESLRKILTSEQAERLPKAEEEGEEQEDGPRRDAPRRRQRGV